MTRRPTATSRSVDAAYDLVGRHCADSTAPDQAAVGDVRPPGNEATLPHQLWARELQTEQLPDCSNMRTRRPAGARRRPRHRQRHRRSVDWDTAEAAIHSRRQRCLQCAPNADRASPMRMTAGRRSSTSTHSIEAGATRTIIPHEIGRMAGQRRRRRARSTSRSGRRRHGPPARRHRQGRLRGIGRRSARARSRVRAPHARVDAYRAIVGETSWRVRAAVRSRRPTSARGRTACVRPYRSSGWCLGVTQHEHGVDAIREIVNVLSRAAISVARARAHHRVRGHSNVQGNRTCGDRQRRT